MPHSITYNKVIHRINFIYLFNGVVIISDIYMLGGRSIIGYAAKHHFNGVYAALQ